MKKFLGLPHSFFPFLFFILVVMPKTVKAGPALEPEKDLSLELNVHEGRVLEAFVVNQSRSQIYPVVQSGDGSNVGWREPYVYYTATLAAQDGTWRPVAEKEISRCGLFSFEWWKDVVRLKPGDRLKLEPWALPEYFLDLPKKGRIKITMHYEYKKGERKSKADAKILKDAGLQDMPAFKIVSKPVEIELK